MAIHLLLGLTGRSLQFALIALIVAPSFILFGYNQSGMGPIANLQSWVHQYPQVDDVNTTGAQKSHNSTNAGAVVASFQIGALIGALSCIFFGDLLGRRKTVFLGSVLTIIGNLLQVSSYSLPQFVVGRIVLGMGIGQFSVTVPIWLSECSEAKNRGRHVILAGIFMCLGYSLCNWLDFAFTFLPYSNLQWRLPLALSFAPSSLICLAVFCFPESPRWLVKANRTNEASISLAAYKGVPETHDSIAAEIGGIEHSLETSDKKISLIGIFTLKEDPDRLLYRLFLCIGLQFLQQMCGGNLISVYASTIFQNNLNMSPDLAKILASCALTWKFLCCFVAFFCIDRLGRRTVFIVSGIGMSLCMAALAVTTSFSSSIKGASIASATFIFLFNLFYPIGFLGGNFLYCTEVAPIQLRTAMNSVSTANHWLWNFVVVMITPVALNSIGYRYYIMYAIISACIPIAVGLFYPETMGRNLEMINHVFRDASSPWTIVAMARNVPKGDLTENDVFEQSNEKQGVSFEQRENA
jgi:sugar porter (SP) family MFS transporter